MPIAINGSGTVTGVSVGGLPDGIVDTDMLAASAVTDPKTNLTGIVKAWIKFDGEGTVAINGSANISALTDNGTGDYTVTFSTAMPDTNYAAVGMGSANGGNGSIGVNTSSHTPLLYSTTQCRFCNSNTNSGALLDGGAIGATFIR